MTDLTPAGRERVSYATVPMSQTAAGGSLLPATFGDVVAFAQLMARAEHAIPKHLRDNAGACLAVSMQAFRWEMDPFSVALKSYKVGDVIAYESQLVAAVVNSRAGLRERPLYEYSGEGQKRRCKVTLTFADGSVRSYETPEVGKITTKNSPLWKSDEDQQLGYFAIRSAARRHCPEVLLGVYDRDEMEGVVDHGARVVPDRAAPAETLRIEANAQARPIEIMDAPEPETVEIESRDVLEPDPQQLEAFQAMGADE